MSYCQIHETSLTNIHSNFKSCHTILLITDIHQLNKTEIF